MKLTSAPSPALAFVRRNDFLTKPNDQGKAAAIELRPTAPDTVEVIVGDPWLEPGDETKEADEFYADTAASTLESVVDGVKLIVKTRDGYVGQAGFVTGDEQYFGNTLPGLTSQAAEVGWDLDKDGTVGDDESAFLFPVATQADVDRLDPIVRNQMGEYPVVFNVEG
ncbi:MAG: hypothetical protein JWL76_1207 [Thermoleophilia bacterium]|nr:hypothetical protein [Thermoleophilia bacterium]